MSFTWWKIYSVSFYILTLLFVISFFMGFFSYFEIGLTRELFFSVGLAFAILSTLLIYSLSLNIVSFILITILSFNPIIWIINYLYIKKRLEFLKIQNEN